MSLSNPVPGAIVGDQFGPRGFVPGVGFMGEHTGQDFEAPAGTPIFAANNGRVDRVWIDKMLDGRPAGGNMVSIVGDGVETRYAHMLNRTPLNVGDTVVAGKTVVGLVGSTGASNGPHLHFEVLIGGVFVDPMPLLNEPTPEPDPEQPKTKGSKVTLYYTTANDKRGNGGGGTDPTFALAGDSPGTPANWLETKDLKLAQQWAEVHGNAVWLSKAIWARWKGHYSSALKIQK